MLKLKLIRSSNGCSSAQKANLRSLKLKKIGDVSEVMKDFSTLGRIKKIQHLILIEEKKND